MIKGIHKVSLIDFPGKIATTLFTAGCNFRCGWCHNWDLVAPERHRHLPDISERDVMEYLIQRQGKIQGVCVTGGEPTLWGERLALFLEWCKREGFAVKLDTNGYLPEVLTDFIHRGILDFIAMDIKNTWEKYLPTVGGENFPGNFSPDHIQRSIKIIKDSKIAHQFRTTLVPETVNKEEMLRLEEWLGEAIVFQNYQHREPKRMEISVRD